MASRLRLVVEYDGTDFVGWQRQADGRTVQGVLERSVEEVTNRREARVVGAGRTDAGVHASGQVAHVDAEWAASPHDLARALNAVLPPDVAIRACDTAPEGFHARHSAVARAYRYTVWRGAVRSPLLRRTSCHVPVRLRLGDMADAAELLLGAHDFGAFGSAQSKGGSTVRRLDVLRLREDGGRLTIDMVANAFLRHQVRRTVGYLVDVGRGRFPASSASDMLARLARAPVARRAPAHGLMLTAVVYPPEEMTDEPVTRAEGSGSES